MRKILLVIVSMLFSVSVFAHPGHSPLEFISIIEVVKHYFTSSHHIATILVMSMVLIASAILIQKRRQILSTMLMVLGLFGSILGIGLLLS